MVTQKNKKKFCFITICLFLGGCVTTEIKSFTDPDFKSKKYSHLMVQSQSEYLDQQDQIETLYIGALGSTKAQGDSYLKIFSPTRKYSDSEINVMLAKHRIDGILVIKQTQYYEDQKYVPQNSSTYGQGTITGNEVNTYSHTNTSGGFYVTHSRLRHEITLYDARTKRTVWIGGAFTAGKKRNNFKEIYQSLANETVKHLILDGVVEGKK
jgi:hypothetical protein